MENSSATAARIRELESRLSALQQSHDRLLAALKLAELNGCNCYAIADPFWHSDRCALPVIRAAIAEATPQEENNG